MTIIVALDVIILQIAFSSITIDGTCNLGTQNSSYMKSVTATVTSIPPNSNTLHPLLVMEFPLVMKNDL